MNNKPNQITESESRDMLLDSYVTYVHTHHCTNCDGIETFSQCFEVWLHPTKTRTSNLRDMRPVVGPLKPLNMTVLSAPGRNIPICHRCAASYRVVGRPEIVTVQSTNNQWQETLRRKYAPAPTEPKVAARSSTPAKVIPSLDQI
jgi:hypothetical protein